MATPTETLTLAQWLSPAFPVGAYAYSHGLEAAIESGAVASAAQAQEWISTVLHEGAGWNDSLLLHAAHMAANEAELDHIDRMARALCASAERLKESDLQGRALSRAITALGGGEIAPRCYPVALGNAACQHHLPAILTAQYYLHAMVSNLAAVAMRLVPLGQSAGQAIIHALTPDCIAIAERTADGDLEALSAKAFMGDIAAMRHETQYSRIFRT